MIVNLPELLPTAALRPNSDNPKRPLGIKYRRGLTAALEEFGFAGVLVVAANADGTWMTLDGTTRLDVLDREGVESVPCIVLADLAEGMPDWQERRREFVLSHDRNRKVFDEDAVLGQLRQLAERGRDLKRLAVLSTKDNLERLLAAQQAPAAGAAPAPKTAPMASLVLYGPAADLAAIKELLKQTKGPSLLGKARAALGQAAEFFDWTEERQVAILLATVARFGKESAS